MNRIFMKGLPIAKSALHEYSSLVIKSIRNKRKNLTISHIPIRHNSISQKIPDLEKNFEELKTPVFNSFTISNKNTRRRDLPWNN